MQVDEKIQLLLQSSAVLNNISDIPQHSLSLGVLIVLQAREPWSADEFRVIQIAASAMLIAQAVDARNSITHRRDRAAPTRSFE
ncbi:MAG: hypothetical protein ACOY3N_06135 [Bradyrhizobium sp.]|uniref:hypothetical protein n=1 Tax=Bradyrhizobium sp. TaxID=376 RepID=UPI003BF12480